MTDIQPFRAIRPVRDKAHLVASRPIYTYKKKILKAKLIDNPFTFLHVVNPEFGKKKKTGANTPERFKKVRSVYDKFVQKGIFLQEDEPAFYIYRQTKDNQTHTGIIGSASIDDYMNGTIKKHEETITVREEMFADYLDVVRFHAEPVLMVYKEKESLSNLIKTISQARSEYEFTTTDLVKHELWKVTKKGNIEAIQNHFDDIPKIYIADGHHRTSSSVLYGVNKRKQKPNYTGQEPFNYFLSFFIPDSEMNIAEYNRLVKDINGHTHESFINKIEETCSVKKVENPSRPNEKHKLLMYIDQTWYELIIKKPLSLSDQLDISLDADLLTRLVLNPILNIKDLKKDHRIEFVAGTSGLKKIKKEVDKGSARVGFVLYPVNTEELIQISDAEGSLPPKSTWIEPKLRSGLTIYSLGDD